MDNADEKKMLWLATVPFDISEDREIKSFPESKLDIHQGGHKAGSVYYEGKLIYIIIGEVVYAVKSKDLWLAVQEQVDD